MSKKFVIKGKFSLPKNEDKKDKKKAKEEEQKRFAEELRKKNKKLRRMTECNHIDREKGKCRLVPFEDENGNKMRKCSICGAVVMADPDEISPEMLDNAILIIRTMMGVIRSTTPLDEKVDNMITDQLYMTEKLPDIYEKLTSTDFADGKKKKKKDKKHKDKDISYSRANY